jgi:hypothetical protein
LPPPSWRSANLDADGDGSITNAEVRDFLSKFVYTEELVVKIFSGIDVDASGDLSAEELREAFVKFPALRTAPGLGGLENTEVRSTWPAADDGASAKDIYAMADAVL